MKRYEITIKPVSGFGTPLQGDTLFGHFCWRAVHDPEIVNKDIDELLKAYPEKPFAVFSSAFPKLESDATRYYLKKPDLPIHLFADIDNQDRKKRINASKIQRGKKWMVVKEDLYIDTASAEFIDDQELADQLYRPEFKDSGFLKIHQQAHNTINRLLESTGKGFFAPFTHENTFYHPSVRLALFVLFDKALTGIEQIKKGLKEIGRWGYGRDASAGMGRFIVEAAKELPIKDNPDANACYTLAPSVPEKDNYSKIFSKPFVRFGKHGDRLAKSGNPFKRPMIMADEGAVLVPKDGCGFFKKSYMGSGITGVSFTMNNTVNQGYAPYLPFKLEY